MDWLETLMLWALLAVVAWLAASALSGGGGPVEPAPTGTPKKTVQVGWVESVPSSPTRRFP